MSLSLIHLTVRAKREERKALLRQRSEVLEVARRMHTEDLVQLDVRRERVEEERYDTFQRLQTHIDHSLENDIPIYWRLSLLSEPP